MLADQIARMIEEMLEESGGSLELRRNEMAGQLGCVPSQISYVSTSRFTPERGYIIESRRGGGGYIKIKRVVMSNSSALMHIINSIGDTIDIMSARIVIENCLQSSLIDKNSARLMYSAISNNVMRTVPVMLQDYLRAAILKEMLLVQI